MSKSNRNSGKSWTRKDISTLKNLANKNIPTRVIGFKLGRTPKAKHKSISRGHFSKTNQSEPLQSF